MPTSHFILVIELDPHRTRALAAQLVRIGVEPVRVADLEEACSLVRSRAYSFSAVLVPSALPSSLIDEALRAMREIEPALPAMAYGKTPDAVEREALRSAGVHLALWEGHGETTLRFQINRLVAGDQLAGARATRRAPANGPVRMLVGDREKRGSLFSVSEGGCFVETPRASMDGARLRVCFELEGEPIALDGIVAFANVPGNLQRPNLPLGMGIHFESVDERTREILARVTRTKLGELDV